MFMCCRFCVAVLNSVYVYVSVGVGASACCLNFMQDKSEDAGHLKQNSGTPKRKRDELQLRTSPRKKLGDTSPKKIDELKLRTSPRKKEGASNLKKNDEVRLRTSPRKKIAVAIGDDLNDEKVQKSVLPEIHKRKKEKGANMVNTSRFQVFRKICNTKLPSDGFLPHPLNEEVFKMGCTAYIGRKECNALMSMKEIGVNHLFLWIA